MRCGEEFRASAASSWNSARDTLTALLTFNTISTGEAVPPVGQRQASSRKASEIGVPRAAGLPRERTARRIRFLPV